MALWKIPGGTGAEAGVYWVPGEKGKGGWGAQNVRLCFESLGHQLKEPLPETGNSRGRGALGTMGAFLGSTSAPGSPSIYSHGLAPLTPILYLAPASPVFIYLLAISTCH